MKKKFVVVGAGLAGSFLSRELAELGYEVHIIEKRSHVGGNLYEEIDKFSGCTIHKYGPHIFHTDDDWAWEYINKFSDFEDYKLTTKVFFKDFNMYVDGPFNFRTIDTLYSKEEASKLREKLIETYFKDRNFINQDPLHRSVSIIEMMNAKDPDIKEFANILWDNDYKLYSSKQWGIPADKVSKNILSRVQFYLSYWDGIFKDKYIGMPSNGYNHIFKNMLGHKNIVIHTDIQAKDVIKIKNKKMYYNNDPNYTVIWTGAIDELFDYKYGELNYRTLEFKYSYAPHIPSKFGAPSSHILPPHHYDFTRITNYGRLPIQNEIALDVLCYEYPKQFDKSSDDERFYPVNAEEDAVKYIKYGKLANPIKNLYLCGRLAEYKYYDMDKVLIAAKEVLRKIEQDNKE